MQDLGFIVSHFGDGLAPEETDQAYFLPKHLKSQLHFGNNGQTVSEWSAVKFYDLTADAGTALTSQRCATSPVSTLDWQMQVCTSLK